MGLNAVNLRHYFGFFTLATIGSQKDAPAFGVLPGWTENCSSVLWKEKKAIFKRKTQAALTILYL